MSTRTVLLTLAALLTLVLAGGATNQLRVQDPKLPWRYGQGTIEQAVVSVRPIGNYMEYGLYLTFSARGLGFGHADTMEVQFQFELPAGSVMHDSWLWIGDTIIRADIMDKWTAEQIYEEIVNRRRDPSILYKRSETQYELRIFPMLGDESRKVKITYLVPAQWNAVNVNTVLPTALVRTSRNAVPGLSVVTWPGGEWVNPRFLEVPTAPFLPEYDSTNGEHYRADLLWGSIQSTVRFAVDAPLREGMHASTYQDGSGGYYQLALLPSAALDLTVKRKTAVLFDHTAGNSSVPTSELLASTKNILRGTMTERDSFNLIFSQVNVHRASDRWLPADSATVESVFTALGSGPIASYSNLPALLANAIDFVKSNGDAGDILLVASSDQFGESAPANQLIEDLLALMTTVIPVHAVEYQTTNFSYHWIGGRYYYGNEYFYTNITRLTGGNLSMMRQTSYPYGAYTPFGTVLQSAFEAVGGFISSFDLYTRTQSGYCYSRINAGGEGQPVYIDRPILQSGRYYGTFPMTVEVSGVYDGEVFNSSFVLDDTTSAPTDSLAEESWTGNYIRQLELQSQTNDVVSEIVRASTTERVLSIYSAFLALEPSRGGEVCYDCIDESGEITDVEDEPAGADTLELLRAYPNPFNASTTIRVSVPAGGGPASLAIYDVLGREIRNYDLAAARAAGTTEVTWNGTDASGVTVNSGVYFVVYRTGAGTQTLKLMMLK